MSCEKDMTKKQIYIGKYQSDKTSPPYLQKTFEFSIRNKYARYLKWFLTKKERGEIEFRIWERYGAYYIGETERWIYFKLPVNQSNRSLRKYERNIMGW